MENTIKISDDKKYVETTTYTLIEDFVIQQKRMLAMPQAQVDAINARLSVVEDAGIDINKIEVPVIFNPMPSPVQPIKPTK